MMSSFPRPLFLIEATRGADSGSGSAVMYLTVGGLWVRRRCLINCCRETADMGVFFSAAGVATAWAGVAGAGGGGGGGEAAVCFLRSLTDTVCGERFGLMTTETFWGWTTCARLRTSCGFAFAIMWLFAIPHP